MIKTIKASIGLDPITSLTKRSSKIVDVFTTTISKLTKVNIEVDKEIEIKLKEREKLERETEDLDNIMKSNQKVIDKLHKLFD